MTLRAPLPPRRAEAVTFTAAEAADAVARLRSGGSVFAEDEAALLLEAASTRIELRRLVDRRVAGEPLEQILGWALFCGIRVSVEAGVFVPRRRTEFAVATVLRQLATLRHSPLVMDLCCGSGAAGMAIEAGVTDVEVVATDIDPRAVHCARSNLRRPDLVFEGDLFAAVPAHYRGRFDAIVANAPYVPSDEIPFMPRDARLFEPFVALDGGRGGTEVQARVAASAAQWLRPGGVLVIETSSRQAATTQQLLGDAGFAAETLSSSELDAVVVLGRVGETRP